MRATLEQLQAMTDTQLLHAWFKEEFPFDMARCGSCVTMHGATFGCGERGHEDFTRSAGQEGIWYAGYHSELRKNLEKIYALRLFFDSLYPPAEPEIGEESAPCCTTTNAELVASK